MAHSISRSITASFDAIATNIDGIIGHLEKSFLNNQEFDYELHVSGNFAFDESGTDYRFSDIKHFKDALVGEQLDDIWYWNIAINVSGGKKGTESYLWNSIVGLDLDRDSRSTGNSRGTRLNVDEIEYSEARQLMDDVTAILKSTYYTPEIVDPSQESRQALAKKSFDILNNLLPLQARITKVFENEKDFQNFLFPILKSHFPTLQEEDYLPKLAGKASKPDFGIIDEGIAFEVKFNKGSDLLNIRKEILIDSREYFGKSSPFKVMVVVIYNASGQPIPANYIEDLEDLDVIYNVAISPPVIPAAKIAKTKLSKVK